MLKKIRLKLIFENKVSELFMANGITEEVLELNYILDKIVTDLQLERVGVQF